eukprot:symbB.v1.2.015185.t1/scaffold1044.1/size142232/6
MSKRRKTKRMRRRRNVSQRIMSFQGWRLRPYRNAGERVPGLAKEFLAMSGALKIVVESHAWAVFRVREQFRSFVDELSLLAVQIYGACPLADGAFLSFRPETDEGRSARTTEEQTLTYELESFPDRFVRFLMRSNFIVQTQCERQIQACVHLLDNIERVTNYEPLQHIRDAFAEISMAVMVAQMASRVSPRHRSTLHIHRLLQADTGGDAPPEEAGTEEMDD